MTATGQMGGLGQGPSIPPGEGPLRDHQGRQSLTALDYVTRLFFPLAFLVGALSQLSPDSWAFWVMLGLALISFVVGIYHPSRRKLKGWRARRRDKTRAQEAYPQLKRFVSRFEEFVNPDDYDVVGEIVRKELRQEHVTSRDELGMTNERLFRGFWLHLKERLAHRNPESEAVLGSLSEFNYMLTQYLTETVDPVYKELPRTVEPEQLPDDAKRQLKAFREKLNLYLNEYEQFAEELSDSLETRQLKDPYLPRPNPLP